MFAAFLLYCAIGTTQIDADISQEEGRLLSLGVDVRSLGPLTDAKPDYAAIAQEIVSLGGKAGKYEEILLKLEAAAAKPAAHFTRTQRGDKPIDRLNSGVIEPIDDWCQNHAHFWAKQHDWVWLDRLYKFEKRFKEQLLLGDSSIFGLWLPEAGNPPLGYLVIDDAKSRGWLRRKLEAFDLEGMRLAKLGRFGRLAREAKGAGRTPLRIMSLSDLRPRPPEPPPKWKQESENDPLFRKKADLATLRQLNVLAAEALHLPLLKVISLDLRNALWELLDKEGSNPAAWAADHLDLYSSSDHFDVWGWNMELIELDLREARDAGRPLVPTWSKRYCIDPNTGAPINVRTTKKGFTLSSRSDNGEWHRTTRWEPALVGGPAK